MNNWLTLTKEQQLNIFANAGVETGLPPFAIEKDAWVTLVLRMLFNSELNDNIVFKGGTSLSKVYGLINRFSEDLDFTSVNPDFVLDKKTLHNIVEVVTDRTEILLHIKELKELRFNDKRANIYRS